MNAEEGYEQLRKIALKHLSNVAVPFSTYIGDDYRRLSGSRGEIRLMYVGKANNGWRDWGSAIDLKSEIETTTLDRSREFGRDFIVNDVATRKYRSAYWYFLLQLAHAVSENAKLSDTDVLRRVVWTNLMRIGADQGNPHGKLAADQADICAAMLKAEIMDLRPQVVVLCTNGAYPEVASKVFGPNTGWTCRELGSSKRSGNRIWSKGLVQCPGTQVFLTRHPQGWRRPLRDKAVSIIAGNEG